METTVKLTVVTYIFGIGTFLSITLIAILAITGKPPGMANYQRFEPKGIMEHQPEQISRIELTVGQRRVVFTRVGLEQWTTENAQGTLVSEVLASHLTRALRFIHVSAPTRVLPSKDFDKARLMEFGLDPPRYRVALFRADKPVIMVDFGTLNPPMTAQYAHVIGRPSLYLLPLYVGQEWEVLAGIKKPLENGDHEPITAIGQRRLFHFEVDDLAVVEIAIQGALYRLERSPSGEWYLHGAAAHTRGTGQGHAHVIDPAASARIAKALGMLMQARADRVIDTDISHLSRYGLERPSIILLFYGHQGNQPLSTLYGGDLENFGWYVRMNSGNEVVLTSSYYLKILRDLLQSLGI